MQVNLNNQLDTNFINITETSPVNNQKNVERQQVERAAVNNQEVNNNENVSNNIKANRETNNLDKIKEAVDFANKTIEVLNNTHLNYSIDKESQKIVVKVIDNETEEVIRQFPPKELLDLINNLEKYGSLIYDKKF